MATPTYSTGYPVHVDARLDPDSQPLAVAGEWLPAIPHCIVLLLLWLAFVVMSVVAFFAILFTGRCPRATFDVNVGVLRWSWRVTYYAHGARRHCGDRRHDPRRPDCPGLDILTAVLLSTGGVLLVVSASVLVLASRQASPSSRRGGTRHGMPTASACTSTMTQCAGASTGPSLVPEASPRPR